MDTAIYKKIHLVRAAIKASDLKKLGTNEYSNYDYYTPEQVDSIVYNNCTTNKLFNKYELKRDEHGLYGEVTVIDLATGESATWISATAMPTITATNDTQQMGGCMTYSERYMLMFIYDIKDNNLDPDSQNNKKKASNKLMQPQGSPNTTQPGEKEKQVVWLKKETPAYAKARAAILDGTKTIRDIRKVYGVSKKLAKELEAPGPDNIPEPGPEEDTGLPF